MWGAGRGGCSSFCCVVRPFSGKQQRNGWFVSTDGWTYLYRLFSFPVLLVLKSRSLRTARRLTYIVIRNGQQLHPGP